MHDLSATLRFGTPLPRAKRAMILIHGRGSSPDDMVGLAEMLPPGDIAFLAPGAEGGTWYPNRFLAPLQQNEPQLSAALRVLEQLVAEVRAAGVAPPHLGLLGFSQGACLALEFAARHPAPYFFVAALSGGLIGPLDAPRPPFSLPGTPVLLGCAEHDAHIPLPSVEHSAEVFTRAGAHVTKQIYPGSAHTVFPLEIRWLKERLRGTVGGSAA